MGCSLEEKNLNCNRFKLILKTNYFSPHSTAYPISLLFYEYSKFKSEIENTSLNKRMCYMSLKLKNLNFFLSNDINKQKNDEN